MLMPAKTKYRKRMKGRHHGLATQGNSIAFGNIALKATDRGFLSSRQIEAARRAISRALKRSGKLWIRVFPDKPITKRPIETRMGHGKGSVEYYVCVIKPGRIIFEVDGVDFALAKEAFRLAKYKLPFPTIVETRE